MASEFSGEKSRVRLVALGCPASLVSTSHSLFFCQTEKNAIQSEVSVNWVPASLLLYPTYATSTGT